MSICSLIGRWQSLEANRATTVMVAARVKYGAVAKVGAEGEDGMRAKPGVVDWDEEWDVAAG